MPVARRRLAPLLCSAPLALGLSACAASSTSTASFKGEAHEVAAAVSRLQSDLSSENQKKVCTEDLSAAAVARLRSTSTTAAAGGCEQAIKNQLQEVGNVELDVVSVKLGAGTRPTTAMAKVGSIYNGKTRVSELSLVKEAGKWKLDAIS